MRSQGGATSIIVNGNYFNYNILRSALNPDDVEIL